MSIVHMLVLSSTPVHILITACTHTAVDNLLALVESVLNELPQLLGRVALLKVDSSNYEKVSSLQTNRSTVIGSTLWALSKLASAVVFHAVFIDEATQVLTGDAVLALNRLAESPESRLIIVGDPLQLPPIKLCRYPRSPAPTPDITSSIFHCLLRDAHNVPLSLHNERPFDDIGRCPFLSVFNDNHREPSTRPRQTTRRSRSLQA
jgi:hypothetical protein